MERYSVKRDIERCDISWLPVSAGTQHLDKAYSRRRIESIFVYLETEKYTKLILIKTYLPILLEQHIYEYKVTEYKAIHPR